MSYALSLPNTRRGLSRLCGIVLATWDCGPRNCGFFAASKPTMLSLFIVIVIGIVAREPAFADGGPAGVSALDYPPNRFPSPSDNRQLQANLIHSDEIPVSDLIERRYAASPLRDRNEIVLLNPAENSRDAQYLLNGAPYVMKPGAMQKLNNDRVWKVTLDTGTGRVLPYTLASGTYKFKPTGFSMSMGLFATQDPQAIHDISLPMGTAFRGQGGPTSGAPLAFAPAPLSLPDYAAYAEKRLSQRNPSYHSSDYPGPMISASHWFNTGGMQSPDQFRGKVILLDFWGSWCGPCVRNLPKVQSLYERYKDRGLVVIGVHSAQGGESVAGFLANRPLSFPIAIDTGATAERYGVEGFPTYFLIDKSGQVRRGFGHNVPSEQQIEMLLN